MSARDLALALALARDLDLDRDLDRDRDRDRVLTLDFARDRARDLRSALDQAAARAGALVGELEAIENGGRGVPRAAATGVVPARVAARVLARATRMLPARDRARYREELDAELLDLAPAEATRRAQLAHTLRLTVRVWSLRRALRASSPAGERAR